MEAVHPAATRFNPSDFGQAASGKSPGPGCVLRECRQANRIAVTCTLVSSVCLLKIKIKNVQMPHQS